MTPGLGGASWPVVELRQYTLVPGQRDRLIDLFDTYFLDGQAAAGISVIGQFRDLDDADRFVWMRGFDSMRSRRESLRSFYFGPIWHQHRVAANATMVDSDNVLLIKPVELTPTFPQPGSPRGQTESTGSVITVTVLVTDGPVEETLVAFVRDRVLPEVAAAGGEPIAVYLTEAAPNDFPELPVRADNVVVWLARFSSDDALASHRETLAASRAWRDDLLPTLLRTAVQPLQELRLRPTERSKVALTCSRSS